MINKENGIGFFTCEDFKNFSEDDKVLVNIFKQKGFDVTPFIWNDPEINLYNYNSFIFRSTWDYHLQHKDFMKWLELLNQNKIRTWNPAEVIKWNMDKTYLKDLSTAGLNVVPTEFLMNPNEAEIEKILNHKWEEIVIKPSISATAHKTWNLKKENVSLLPGIVTNYADEEIILVQKFMPEIKSKGEISFIFFNKVYSHAVLKTVKDGDFRVQKNFGGETKEISPPQELISQAQGFVNYIKDDLLYARVDCVESGGKLILMELELIEPELFFSYNEKAALTFYKAFMKLNKK